MFFIGAQHVFAQQEFIPVEETYSPILHDENTYLTSTELPETESSEVEKTIVRCEVSFTMRVGESSKQLRFVCSVNSSYTRFYEVPEGYELAFNTMSVGSRLEANPQAPAKNYVQAGFSNFGNYTHYLFTELPGKKTETFTTPIYALKSGDAMKIDVLRTNINKVSKMRVTASGYLVPEGMLGKSF